MRYIISVTEPGGYETAEAPVVEHDPQNAIIAWFRLGERYPTCVAIQADSEGSAFELLKWAGANRDKMEVWMKEHRCPYRSIFLFDSISSYIKQGRSSMQWEYDQVSPFSFG